MAGSQTYKDVRSLARGMRLIEVLSERGWMKPGELSGIAQIDRSSTYRLLNTLILLGYVVRRNEDGFVALTMKLAQLADNVKDDDIITQLAWAPLLELCQTTLWPSDFASFKGGSLTIRLSTHRVSPMSIHRGVIGKERSLTRSALGKAILSAMTPDERQLSHELVAKLGKQGVQTIKDRDAIETIVRTVAGRGYASSVGETEAKISAIAAPVRNPDGSVAGAVNIVFFTSAMTPEQAAGRYLANLRRAISRIEHALEKFMEERSAADQDPAP